MKLLLTVLQVVVGITLTAAILLQQKGTGLGTVFGGAGNVFSTKRGIDKILFRATIFLSVLFFVIALSSLFV
ncbi:MAG: preprotein translocase subunit SecG [Patescibacteria group bacterium]